MTLIGSLVGLLLSLAACTPARAQSVVIGGKNFTEQQLIAEITGQFLTAKGLATRVRTGFSTAGIRKELEAGLVDVYWEYTGTALVTFHDVRDKLDHDEAYTRVKELDGGKGLIWLAPSRVNNTYALAMRRADAAAKGISTLSDLAVHLRQGEDLRFACNTEFYIRPDGLLPLQRTYRFAFGLDGVVRRETNAIYEVLRDDHSIAVGLVFATDGRIVAYDFLVLKDDKGVFPSYVLTPVIRKRVLDQNPELADHLNAVAAKLNNATIMRLNAMIDVQKKGVEAVALWFLRTSGLLP